MSHYLLICESFYKCTKDYNKNKESSNLKYWDINNLYAWAMYQRLPLDGFK